MMDASHNLPCETPDSARRAYAALVALLALVLAAAHYQPALAYPLAGMWTAASLFLLFALAVVVSLQSRLDLRGLTAPALALAIFAAWGWARTAFSAVPAEGSPFVGNLLLGLAVFYLGAFVVRGSRLFADKAAPSSASSALSPQSSALSTQHSALTPQSSVLSTQSSVLSTQHSALSPQSSALSTQSSVLTPQSSVLTPQSSVLSTQSSALSTQHSALPYTLAQWLLAFFFCVLAAATACHAILQYHYVYPLRFEELRATAALQPNDPLLEGVTHALRTGRVSSWFGNPNVFCGFLAMCLPFLAAAGWSARGRWRWAVRIAAAGVAGALFYAAFRTGSAGGNLVLIAGVLLLGAAFLLRKRAAAGMGTKVCSAGFSLSSFLFLCACLFLGGGKPGAPEVVAGEGVSRTQAPSPQHSVLTTQSSVLTTQPSALSPPSSALSPQPSALSPQHSALSTQHSALTTQRSALSTLPEGPRQSRTILQRVYYLRSGLAMWRERPFVGHGAGAYARLYPRTRIPGAGETRYAHNFLVQLAVELGLVGVGLFVWVLLLAVKRFAEGLRSGQANALWVCTGISLLLFLLDSLGDYTFYVREIYLDFCLLLGAFVAAAPPPAGPPARQSASLPVGQSASRPVCQSASRPVGQSAGMPVYEPTFHPSSFALHPSFLSTQHSALGTLLLLAGGVLLVLAGLWLEIVPAQMAAHHRQITEDLWTAAADAGREGKAMQQRGLMEDALRQADRALSWQPGNPWLWQLRANAYGSVGRPDAMRYDLQRAISLHPDSAALRAGLADLEWRQGEQRSLGEDARREARARAMELLRQALALYPLKSGLHEQHARYLAESGKGKEALEAARVAVRLAFTPLEIESARKTLQEIEKAELTTETQRHRE